MKRIFGVVIAAILSINFLLASNAAAASTNNFRISSYVVAYELSRNSENQSTLKTTETITAEFPQTDQNHGLERALPTQYDGHSTSLEIVSVKDRDGADIEYSREKNNGVDVLRIGNPDEYVHGAHTYQIIYTQQNVTDFFSNTNRDEWYWDVNGDEWKVPIDALTVFVKIDESIASAREGEAQCYFGKSGSTDTCRDTEMLDNGLYRASVAGLAPGETVTLAFGFTKGTFAEYAMSLTERLAIIWAILQAITGFIALALSITLVVLGVRRHNRAHETNPIVAEYIPPKDASVTVASQVAAEKSRAVFSAQLIDLAVRHYIAIIETREKSVWKSAEYDIKITRDSTDLKDEEKEILTDMFGHEPKEGERIALSSLSKDLKYVSRTTDNTKKLKKLVNETYGLREKSPTASKFFYRWAIGLLIASVLTLSFSLAIIALLSFIIGKVIRPLTDKGLALRRYVFGLDRYIKASETERIKFLQGPDTAEKIGYDVDPQNPGEMVKLYERTLPYAVLFGREKQWANRLGEYYLQGQGSPDWYTGQSTFNAALFGASLANFSQASLMAAGYSAGSSSSSGGSGGGGFAGGGGGGGGGGGW